MMRQLPHQKLRRRFARYSLIRQALQPRQPREKQGAYLEALSQSQALSALELGLGIKQQGYNIFVVGVSGTGRTSVVNHVLRQQARKLPAPQDIILLYNFVDRDRPLSLRVDVGLGPKIKKTYDLLVERMLVALERAFEADLYAMQRQRLQEQALRKTEEALADIEHEASTRGFALTRTAASITLSPADESGDAITEEQFDKLSAGRKHELERRAARLEKRLEEALGRVRLAERESEEAIEKLQRETARQAVAPLFEAAISAWRQIPRVAEHLAAVQEDLLNRLRYFVSQERHAPPEASQSRMSGGRAAHEEEEEWEEDEPLLMRYRVNVLVTHRKGKGAPVVQETHPTLSNLVGRIEQRLRGGETITDFTRIRAGALYRANGGYLIIDAGDLLRDLSAWEGLKQALKNQAIELDDPGEPGRMVSVASLRPEPVTLSLKVVLIGTPDIYYSLSRTDPDFDELFKVKADFDSEVRNTDERVKKYVRFLVKLCEDEKLRSLTTKGAGRVMEHATRLAGNQGKVTARLCELADLVREADFWAHKKGAACIDVDHVQQALRARAARNGFLEAHMLEDILEGRVCIETEGAVVGQCNALTVVELGGYEFGVPVRITCRIGCGRGEIVDIERETKLGGPLHTKGTLILRGLLADRFGCDIPLGFCATLCMEQSYTGVDGDSASLAEACTLLSMLARAPLCQNIAITGSLDQRGRVQAVGGINEKIEGFFKLCRRYPNQAPHGVIIPAVNASDAMLSEEVVEACREGNFVIHTVDSFEDALQILTGRPWHQGENPLEPAIRSTLQHLHTLRTGTKAPLLSMRPVAPRPSNHYPTPSARGPKTPR